MTFQRLIESIQKSRHGRPNDPINIPELDKQKEERQDIVANFEKDLHKLMSKQSSTKF
jgi:hypothetical protein